MDRVEMIRTRLEVALSPTQTDIVDESHLHAGHAGGHFNVTIVAEIFTGKSTIERHRMVYLAVNDLMPSEIHALSIRALAPEEV